MDNESTAQCELKLIVRTKLLSQTPQFSYCIILKQTSFKGLIAQWIEHPPSKRVVVGSNPTQSNMILGRYTNEKATAWFF